ncbi:MAG: hypothetical protein JO033_01610 [Acidobacteriaceae bacterium]|nr:hypothetical protein [Acidobacteriaceae bacterium]
MTFFRPSLSFAVASVLLLGGCVTRQLNPPITKYDESSLREVQRRWQRRDQQDLVVLAFSGGGTSRVMRIVLGLRYSHQPWERSVLPNAHVEVLDDRVPEDIPSTASR